MAGPKSSAIDLVEHGLISGHARWVADLNEFFRSERIGNTVFDLYARGRTRSRGFLLSRFFAWSVMPDYKVALLCKDGSKMTPLSPGKLRTMIDDALHLIVEDELKWVWLVLLTNEELLTSMVSFVKRYDRKELGLGVGSTRTGQLILSDNQVGRSIGSHLRLKRIIEKLAHGQAN